MIERKDVNFVACQPCVRRSAWNGVTERRTTALRPADPATDGSAAGSVSGQVRLHILRHTFCSHLAMRGAPARGIQKVAGHSELGVTQRNIRATGRFSNEER